MIQSCAHRPFSLALFGFVFYVFVKSKGQQHQQTNHKNTGDISIISSNPRFDWVVMVAMMMMMMMMISSSSFQF